MTNPYITFKLLACLNKFIPRRDSEHFQRPAANLINKIIQTLKKQLLKMNYFDENLI